MCKVAILCQSLRNYAGAERVVYEITQAFISEKKQVHLGCIDIGDFYHQQLADVRINDLPNCMDDEYDLVICFHTYTLPYFFPNGVKCKKLCYFSLSPYEPIESPLSADIFDCYLCNSNETKQELILCGVAPERINVFKNSCRFNSDNFELKKTLKKVAVVSNHPPKEILDLTLLDSGIEFDYYGIAAKVEMLNDTVLSKYDVVISIGYTVVFAISANVPVYIYDHFGGDGYLNADNYEINSYYNFSGRPRCNKKSTAAIINELKVNFSSAIDSFRQVYELMVAERNIMSRIKELTNFDDYEMRTIFCDALQIKQALAYSRLLLNNRYLQRIIDGNDNAVISQNIINISDIVMHQSRLIEKISNENSALNGKISSLVEACEVNESRLIKYEGTLKELVGYLGLNREGFIVKLKRKIQGLIQFR